MNTYITSMSSSTNLYVNSNNRVCGDIMVSKWDICFGIATGGAYNAGKAAYKGYIPTFRSNPSHTKKFSTPMPKPFLVLY